MDAAAAVIQARGIARRMIVHVTMAIEGDELVMPSLSQPITPIVCLERATA
jgi:hypothetical protein